MGIRKYLFAFAAGIILALAEMGLCDTLITTRGTKYEGIVTKTADGDSYILVKQNGGKITFPKAMVAGVQRSKSRPDGNAGKSVAAKPAPLLTKPPRTVTAKGSAPHAGVDIREVVVSGVGLTEDEATKDAFRNAIRQVVGLVVDSEELVKNDSLVEKILIYSDGFIKTFSKISQKKKGELVRVTIRATVKRRSLVAKLKAVNITVRRMDGKGLFAEAVTQAEGESNSTALLKKALTGLPTFLTATVEGKPKYDRVSSEVVLDILIRVDQKAYRAFAARTEPLLKKLAIQTSSAMIKAKPFDPRNSAIKRSNKDYFETFANALAGPKIPDSTPNGWCIWINSFINGTHTGSRWNGYVVNAEMGPVLGALEGKTTVGIYLLDSEGQRVSEDEIPVRVNGPQTYKPGSNSSDGFGVQLPFLYRACVREKASLKLFEAPESSSVARLLDTAKRSRGTVNLYVAPLSFTVKQTYSSWSGQPDGHLAKLCYQPFLKVQHRMKVTLEELKRISDVKCKVKFQAKSQRQDQKR
jgi:hypothetical protein